LLAHKELWGCKVHKAHKEQIQLVLKVCREQQVSKVHKVRKV
jgi:hypothetical protein